MILGGNVLPIDVGFGNHRPFFQCVSFGLEAALYPLAEEIKSGRFQKSIEFARRAYGYQRQQFVLRSIARPVTLSSKNKRTKALASFGL